MRVNRALALQMVILVFLIVNFALLVRGLFYQCPEITAPQVTHNGGQLMPCTKDPSSTASRLVWNCP